MKSICVFCGSSLGFKPSYRQAAIELGHLFATRKTELIYGGANVGLMKVLADSVLENGGKVIGVMPHQMIHNEIAHNGIHKMHAVSTMAERKLMMVTLSDAFIALPGGYGTLDEMSEILTYNQLRISDKPIGLLNVDGYYDYLLRFFDHGVSEGFIRDEHRNNLIVSENSYQLLDQLAAYSPVSTGKWIEDIKHESLK